MTSQQKQGLIILTGAAVITGLIVHARNTPFDAFAAEKVAYDAERARYLTQESLRYSTSGTGTEPYLY